MAGSTETGGTDGKGAIEPHVASYQRFMHWMKLGTLAAAVAAAVVVFIIAQ